VLSLALETCLVIFISYPFLDASTEEYQEEEVYFQEEEDHFDQYTNQGKLTLLQSAKLYQSKAYSPITLCFMIKSQVLSLQAFTLIN
jgi:hypothetical protein